ncbi:MAG: maleylacetoacetate isomerase [Pseudomonadota bacterium]
MILHNYFRSSTSARVRAALNLKGVPFEYVAHALLKDEHRGAAHLAVNPQGLVPTLVTEHGPLPQSLAIIEWLDETYPDPPLLPEDAWGRARVRSLAHIIALDVHPVNNLRILRALETEFGADADAKARWFQTWAHAGMAAFETRLQEPETGAFCHGDTPGLADLCLFAQVLNNGRFGVELDAYPTIARIHAACMALDAFAAAAPAAQPDAV